MRFDVSPLLTHKTRLNMLKEDVARMCEIVTTLQENRSGMEEWQVAPVERIAPKCSSLGEDVDAALHLLSRSSQPLFAPIYGSLVGDIKDRVTGIVRTTREFLSWAEKNARKR